jgi:hypothetical protein
MITPKTFVDGVNLTDAAVTYYTTATGARAILKKATFVNDHTAVITVTINIVPSGDTPLYGNRIIKAKAIAPGESWMCYELENHEIEAGGMISMLASVTAKIGCRISGYEVT